MTQDAIRAYATFFAGAMDAPIIAAEDLMEILSISHEDAEAIRREIAIVKEQEREVMSIFDWRPSEEGEKDES